jgi:hypothetical protein
MWATCSKPKLPHGQCSQFSKNKIKYNTNNKKKKKKTPYSHIPIHYTKNWLLMVQLMPNSFNKFTKKKFKRFFIFP